MSKDEPNNDYGPGSRLLHRFALAWPSLAKASFDFECSFAAAKPATEQRHVFIAGLARSGTTVLLRAIYNCGAFRSLTYRDMPFVLMPGMWQRLSRSARKRSELRQRAHGDRITVNVDSPEAFEEVFWRVFCGREYISSGCLEQHEVRDETIALYRRYVGQVVASADDSAQTRYLSKNNNNILRLAAIRNAFPEGLIIIPFRHPVHQAESLRRQHRRFTERHKVDHFSLNYMRWLGHHEFGADHRPFRFGGRDRPDSAKPDQDSLDYWLQTWVDAYAHVARNLPRASLLVCYEDLCNNPADYLRHIFKSVGLTSLSPDSQGIRLVESRPKTAIEASASLQNQALELYADLRSRQAV